MNENSSKQVLLSVIGIAVLVVAVVGVSFAFFTYSKTGDRNNTLTTGSIFFNFTEGNAINLTNEFPRTDDSGKSLTKTANGALEFSVVGYDSSSKGIEYTVYALPGAPETGKTRFQDNQIKLYLEASSSNSSTITNNYATPTKISSLTDTGLALATGKITATASGSQQTDKYTLRMWISSDVTIGEGKDYTTTAFGNLYYSLKLKVVAATTGTAQPGV